MVRSSALATMGAMIVIALAGTTTRAESDRARLVVAVELQVQTTVDPKTLFDARGDVTSLYRQEGVDLVWVTEHPALVIILGGDKEACVLKAGARTMGQAFVSRGAKTRRVAYVYYDRVENLAVLSGVEPAHLLGPIMAHEMAHLLGVSHAASGLMRAGWSEMELAQAASGLLHFSPAEREIVRSGAATLPAADLGKDLQLVADSR